MKNRGNSEFFFLQIFLFKDLNTLEAGIAQLVERSPCKRMVVGSNPTAGSIFITNKIVPKINNGVCIVVVI